jgi:hypothetical protein
MVRSAAAPRVSNHETTERDPDSTQPETALAARKGATTAKPLRRATTATPLRGDVAQAVQARQK